MTAVDLIIDVDQADAQRLMRAIVLSTTPAAYARFHYAFTSPYMRSKARERFRTQGDGASGPWQHLTDATEDIRAYLGFSPEEPINVRTGLLERWITGRPGEVTITPLDSGFFFPNRPTSPEITHRLRNAQMGTQGAPTTVFGNPVGRPTPPRPVAAMDATDLIHTLAALEIFMAHEIQSHM